MASEQPLSTRPNGAVLPSHGDDRYERLVNRLPGAVVVWNAAERSVLYVSGKLEQLTGESAAVWLGREGFELWRSRIHPDDRATPGHLRPDGDREPAEYRWVRSDGRQIWVRSVESELPDAEGCYEALLFDVTAEVETSRRLHEQHAIHQTLIEQLPVVVYRDDADTGEATYVSPQIERILGFSEVEWYTWAGSVAFRRARVHPDDLAEVERIARVVDGCVNAPNFSARYRLRVADGTLRWVEEEVVTICDDSGRPLWRQGLIRDIHDQVLAERRYEHLVHRLPAAVVIWNRAEGDSKVLYVSPQFEELTGECPAEWLGYGGVERFAERVHPEDMANPQRWRPPGDPLPSRFRWQRADGTTVWIRVVSAPDTDGNTLSLLVDATTEVEASQQRLRYRTLVEQLPVATYIMDPEGSPTYVSPQFEQIMGRSVEEFMGAGATHEGRTPWFHPDDTESTLMAARDLYEGRSDGYNFRARMLRGDGEIRHVHAIARALKDDQGALTAVQGVLIDVTDEVHAREELEASERRYQALVEQMPVVTYVTDLTGQLTYISPQVEEMFGYSMAEWAGFRQRDVRLANFLHPDDLVDTNAVMGSLYAGEVAGVDFACRVLTKGGETRHVQMIAEAIHDERGAIVQFQGVIVDLTRLRQAEQRNREVLAALVTAAEAEQARIANELHDDTVQVMTAVLLQMQMRSGEQPKMGKVEQMLAEALERTRRLMFELRPQILERDGLTAALIALAGDGPWPESRVKVVVPRQSVTTEALAYRAVRELVVNARKHSRATLLTIDGWLVDGTLVFEVADNGVGFDPAAALDRELMGMHMGLDATIERTRLAGGDVVIDAAPGRGARLRLTLPADPTE